MKRTRLTRNVPPPAPTPHYEDEVTVVDEVECVRLPNGVVKPRIHWCDGRGFALGELELVGGLVSPCWCPAGKRMECAVPIELWPLAKRVAARVARRIGLRRVA
jgi:hypothetical protein